MLAYPVDAWTIATLALLATGLVTTLGCSLR